MDAHLIDSQVFGHLWSTELSQRVFSERGRLGRWLNVIIALAEAQADLGIIPHDSANAIARLRDADLDIRAIAEGTRTTGHSTLGLIHVLQAELSPSAAEHVYYGATVQDITDSSLALEMKAIGQAIGAGLWQIEGDLLTLANEHRDTPMVGRTHGQPGSPITFGFKVASWADETARNLDRIQAMLERCLAGQLAGAVGSLGFFGEKALPLRAAFCAKLQLPEPTISWLTARDRLAEFASVLAMTATTLARIANEVYGLQRQELGELLEATNSSAVGSITMPHKRNPESSEQIVTLARLVRAQAAVLVETMVQEHERDARGWKAEWVALPELCHFATAAVEHSQTLVAGLEPQPAAMMANLQAAGSTSSQRLLRSLAPGLGKHAAQTILNDAYRQVRSTDESLSNLLADYLTPEEFAEATTVDLGAAPEMTEAIVAAATTRRTAEQDLWEQP